MSTYLRSTQNIYSLMLLAGFLLPGSQSLAQAKPDAGDQARIVDVRAIVRDKHGKAVRNLSEADFLLEEDGRAQTVRSFSREGDPPLSLGLVVDTARSQMRALEQERTSSSTFLRRLLRPEKDLAFLIHYDREVELSQDLTSSREKLDSALQSLQPPQFNQDSGGGNPPDQRRRGEGGEGRRSGGAVLNDAMFLASDEVLKKQTGRKAIIVVSDGIDRGSKESFLSAMEAAQRADTVVYCILLKNDEPYRGGGFGGYGGMGRHGGRGRFPQESRPDPKKTMEQIAKETGGRLFESSGKDMDKIYAQIEDDLRSQYSLSYTPEGREGIAYRKISLQTKQKDLTVQVRKGYYPVQQ